MASQPGPLAQVAAEALAARAPVRLALPTRLALLERLTLPSTDPEELAGMTALQLEKTLPYPVEETTHGYRVISSRPAVGEEELGEATVLAVSCHLGVVESLCAPLLEARAHPTLTLWAWHVAGILPREGVTWAIWAEEQEVVFGIFSAGELHFAESAQTPEALLEGLERTLLGAELAGVPTRFDAGRYDPALEPWAGALENRLGVRPEPIAWETVTAEAPPELTPARWQEAISVENRRRKRRKLLLTAAGVYGGLVLLLLAYNGFQAWRLGRVEKEIATLQPQVDALLAYQQHWQALAKVTDRRLATVEVLHQVTQSLPNPEVRITQFAQTPTGIMVMGEASSAADAVSVLEAFKKNEALPYEFSATPPTSVAEGKVQFRIYGK